jgi:hypothetical protein
MKASPAKPTKEPKKEPNLRQRVPGGNYVFRVQVDNKDRWISTGTNQINAAKVQKALLLKGVEEARRTGRGEILGMMKLRSDLPQLAELKEAFEKHIKRQAPKPPSDASAANYWRNLRLVVAWAKGKDGEPAELALEDISLGEIIGTKGAEVVKSFRANWLAAVDDTDAQAIASRRRSGDSMLRQARACFGQDALRCYAEWVMPDVKGFLECPDFGGVARQHIDIERSVLKAMAEAADRLATTNPRLFVIHVAHKFLGLRNSEIEEARVGWFHAIRWTDATEEKPDVPVQWMLEVSERCGYTPKASAGSTPLKREIAAALMQAWKRLEIDPDKDSQQHIVPAKTPTERHDAIYEEHAAFIRQFLPAEDFGKAGYELRRWAFRTMQAKYGSREAARAFLRHAMPADAARHYQARFYPWHTLGDDVGLSFEDARGGHSSLATASEVKSAWASLL